MIHPGEARFREGLRQLQAEDWGAAEIALREAVALLPDQGEAWANWALALERLGGTHPDRRADFFAAAESAYHQALALLPTSGQIRRNLGAMLARQHRYADAEAAYRQAIGLEPDDPANWSNLGVLKASLREDEAAAACYQRALALAPGHGNARFNQAYLWLRQGRYVEGWAAFEARDWYAALARLLPCVRWQGEALTGRTILIGCEAGQGDMIQFIRYAAWLKDQGAARVGVLCHPSLGRLLATAPGVDQVFPLDQPLPPLDWDFWVPLLSLPHLAGTMLETVPARLPYLQGHDAPAAGMDWAGWLNALSPGARRRRIGLVWRGNPRFENDAERSLASPALFRVLADALPAEAVTWVCLQKDPRDEELAEAGFSLAVPDGLVDFAATAGLIQQLDLVISVDTAVAHLTGALGQAGWVLLPWYQTDWRWLEARTDSPWYPGALRLFRQTRRGDWGHVQAALKTALLAWWSGEKSR